MQQHIILRKRNGIPGSLFPSLEFLNEFTNQASYDVFSAANFKVARVVNLKLVFTDQFFYNLVLLIKLYKIRYLN